MKVVTSRIPDNTYQILVANAAKNGESISYYCRKILEREIKNDAGLNAEDVLITAVRKAIRLELKTSENRLANLSAKAAITSATTENLTYLILKNQNLQNPNQARDLARKRAVAYLRENLEQLLELYDKELEGGVNG